MITARNGHLNGKSVQEHCNFPAEFEKDDLVFSQSIMNPAGINRDEQHQLFYGPE